MPAIDDILARVRQASVDWGPRNASGRGALDKLTLFQMEDVAPIPGVEQVALPRFVSSRPITGRAENLGRYDARLLQDVERGLKQNAHLWYHAEPIRQEFIYELGKDAGQEQFDLFAKMIAATSSSAPVRNNLRKASFYRQQALNGLLPQLENAADAKRYVKATEVPSGYGSIARQNDALWSGRYFYEDPFAGLGSAKAANKMMSFGENIRGNYAPMVLDRHEWRARGYPSLPSGAAYGIAEARSIALADELGLDPAAFQAARWMGGAKRTGVRSTDPTLPHALETVIYQQAKRLKTTPDKVLREFIRNGGLLAVPAVAVGSQE